MRRRRGRGKQKKLRLSFLEASYFREGAHCGRRRRLLPCRGQRGKWEGGEASARCWARDAFGDGKRALMGCARARAHARSDEREGHKPLRRRRRALRAVGARSSRGRGVWTASDRSARSKKRRCGACHLLGGKSARKTPGTLFMTRQRTGGPRRPRRRGGRPRARRPGRGGDRGRERPSQDAVPAPGEKGERDEAGSRRQDRLGAIDRHTRPVRVRVLARTSRQAQRGRGPRSARERSRRRPATSIGRGRDET